MHILLFLKQTMTRSHVLYTLVPCLSRSTLGQAKQPQADFQLEDPRVSSMHIVSGDLEQGELVPQYFNLATG